MMVKEASKVSRRGRKGSRKVKRSESAEDQRINKASNPDISDKRLVEERASRKEDCFE
jgi:hypothetical protein